MDDYHLHGYWLQDRDHCNDRGFAEAVARLVEGGRVLDLGCGDGFLIGVLREFGAAAVGVDGSIYSRGDLVHDITQPLPELGKFDWCTLIEVGEHVPAELVDAVLDNIDRAADRVVVSWARPGQGGVGHVNELDQKTVVGMFARRGYAVDTSASQVLRSAASLPWLQCNPLVMRRNEDDRRTVPNQ